MIVPVMSVMMRRGIPDAAIKMNVASAMWKRDRGSLRRKSAKSRWRSTMDVLKTCVVSYTLARNDCTVRNPAAAGSGIAPCLTAVKDANINA